MHIGDGGGASLKV